MSTWQEHIAGVRRDNVGKSFAEITKLASQSYVKPPVDPNKPKRPRKSGGAKAALSLQAVEDLIAAIDSADGKRNLRNASIQGGFPPLIPLIAMLASIAAGSTATALNVKGLLKKDKAGKGTRLPTGDGVLDPMAEGCACDGEGLVVPGSKKKSVTLLQ